METVMTELSSLLGAIVGAIVGAALWAIVSVVTGYEIAILAWVVGGLVGGGSYMFGSEGVGQGMLCGVIALLAILGGKMMTVNYFIDKEFDSIANSELTQSLYNEILEEAQAFNFDGTSTEYREFMVAYDYSGSEYAEDVTDVELQWFMEERMGELVKLQRDPPSYETWRRSHEDAASAYYDEELSTFDIALEDLNKADIIFGIFGVLTAFQIGAFGNDGD